MPRKERVQRAAGESAAEVERAMSVEPSAAARERAGAVLPFAAAILIGAFLLFALQPLIGKYLLPWFGGTVEVWTTCMLFFQVLLVLGYLYAHLAQSLPSYRAQALLHGAVVLAAVVFQPIIPPERWKPTGVEQPALHILWVLLATTGVPFFALAATGPMLQRWLSALRPGRDVYRFYALSNVGSLGALVTYPFLVEPFLTRHAQSWLWSAGFAAYAVTCALCIRPLWTLGRRRSTSPTETVHRADRHQRIRATQVAGRRAPLLWLALPAAGSMMLLASTNMICLEVASFPFLWVLPLALYLLTFVVCFAGTQRYSRPLFVTVAFAAGLGVAAMRYGWIDRPGIGTQVAIYLTAMFACCMIAHGETYRLRPDAERLTAFYLSIAVGGALGGVLVAVVAPLVFRGYLELYVALSLCLALGFAAMRPAARPAGRRWRRLRATGVTVSLVGGVVLLAVDPSAAEGGRTLERTRSFYGVLRVVERSVESTRGGPKVEIVVRQVFNGPGDHGSQLVDVRPAPGAPAPQSAEARAALASWAAQARALPTTYYGEHAGGIAMLFRPGGAERARRIGIVGLGAGTLAAYGRSGDSVVYYELNPDVERVAEQDFTYLQQCRARGARVRLVLGDGRLSLEHEPPASFDVLVVDAFSGDAIPVHLLTREAVALYLDRLATDGVLAIHVTNQYLDLRWVLARIARSFAVPVALVHDAPPRNEFLFRVPSDWVLMSRNAAFLELPEVHAALLADGSRADAAPLWTDDYSSLFAALRRPG